MVQAEPAAPKVDGATTELVRLEGVKKHFPVTKGILTRTLQHLKDPDAENFVPHMYLDRYGNVTVGIGTLLPDAAKAKTLPFVRRGSNISATPQEIERDFNKVKNIDTNELINGRRLTNIGTFRAYIVNYLRKHPKIHQDMTFIVRHLAATEHGLPIDPRGHALTDLLIRHLVEVGVLRLDSKRNLPILRAMTQDDLLATVAVLTTEYADHGSRGRRRVRDRGCVAERARRSRAGRRQGNPYPGKSVARVGWRR